MKLAGLLAASLVLAGCSYRHLIEDGKVDEKYLARIQANVARVTSLSVGEPVPYAVISVAEARAKFARDLDREIPAAEADEQAKTLRAFGFVTGPLDLRKVMIDLISEQAAAFYDPLEKKYFFIDRPLAGGFSVWLACWLVNRDIPNELTASHELVHALQDREHDLEKWWKAAGDDEDAQLARHAVIEGDAMHYGFLAMGLKDVELEREDLIEGATGEAIDRAPQVMKELLVFPYWAGYKFARAARAVEHDPWKKPPGTTAEILDRESPAGARRGRIVLADSKVGGGWTLVRENTLGAFLAGELSGRRGTPGWIDDRYRIFEDAGGQLALAWALEFDREENATAFAMSYSRVQRAKGVKEATVELAGRTVAIAEAPDGETFRVLRDAAFLAR